MSTTIEKSLQRLHWRFSQKNNFKPNETDIDSLNCILKWVADQQKENEREQQLFAKLYTHIFTQQLQLTQNLDRSIKVMNRLCSTPLSEFTSSLHFRINVLKYWAYLQENKIQYIQEPYPTDEDMLLIKEHIENDKKYITYWSLDKVETSITGQITDALHNYKNLI